MIRKMLQSSIVITSFEDENNEQFLQEPRAEGDPVERIVDVGEDMKQVRGVELS